ncbi:NAD-dependent aldehyde dehydrogenase [Trametes coccinea BRFM310]|uniref:Aldehyde dehydrogenase n=1 Tax=Trametes coccinea (strain BRFM310) TaxID=1353009 RepID=A0A1Y2IDT2_TRAC3|nr:NAD-dependent aldehyde dehydrogenase [Trametes coccinea BRFM310]
MSMLVPTPIDEISNIHRRAREAFFSGKTKSIAFRKAQIAQVGYLLKDNEHRFIEALKQDLRRPESETILCDLAGAYIEVRSAYDNVEQWTKIQKADFNLNFFAMSPKLKAEPKGVVLLIAPFNLPTFLVFSPLVSMIAGGNAAVIKPPDQTPACSALIAELVPQYLDNDLYHVVNGGVPETKKLLDLRWDHIFYIGNGRTGRIIAEAAAKHLTPTTMELGGKNPVVLDPKCDFNVAARRILWGRFLNCGQICMAPEYVLVQKEHQDRLVDAMKEVYASFYPEGPENSDSLARIVNEAHAARIKQIIDETKGTIVLGGDADVSKRYIAPTVVRDVAFDDPLFQDEVFGPVLAVVPVNSIEEAIDFINSGESPLAVYVFSTDKSFQSKVFDNTRSGAANANEVVITTAIPGLPMGGVGGSGYGYYTGKQAFEEFTHWRISIDNPSWADKIGFGFRFPPYKPSKMLAMLYPSLPPRPAQGKNSKRASTKSGAGKL